MTTRAMGARADNICFASKCASVEDAGPGYPTCNQLDKLKQTNKHPLTASTLSNPLLNGEFFIQTIQLSRWPSLASHATYLHDVVRLCSSGPCETRHLGFELVNTSMRPSKGGVQSFDAAESVRTRLLLLGTTVDARGWRRWRLDRLVDGA